MGDRSTEWTVRGSLWVDVDPLMIAGGVCEEVDLFLGHCEIVAVAEVLPDDVLEFIKRADDARHAVLLGLSCP